jgi:Prokaryotic E2 family D
MQSRTFLRIEGDLVSLVSETIDREVALPDLLAELASSEVTVSPRLPTNTRFWIRGGTSDRSVFVIEQPPTRRTITYHASRRYDAEPGSFRLSLPYVVYVVATLSSSIELLTTFFRTAPISTLDAPLLCSTLPNTGDDGIVCMGSVRVSGASVGERVDALLAAYWASTFNQDLRRHPLPFPGGFRAWAARSRQDPLAALSLPFDPYWRNLRQVVASMSGIPVADLPIELAGLPDADVRTPELPEAGETDAPAA